MIDARGHGIPTVRGALGGRSEEDRRKIGGNLSGNLRKRLLHFNSYTDETSLHITELMEAMWRQIEGTFASITENCSVDN